MKHSEKSHCFKAFRKQIKLYALLSAKYKSFLRSFQYMMIDAWKKQSFLIYPHPQHDSANACFLGFHLRYYQHYTDFCYNSVKNVGKIARKFLIFEFKILSQTVWEAFLKTAIFDTLDMSAWQNFSISANRSNSYCI